MDKKILINILQVITMLFWSSFLINSDSYYIPYLLTGIIAFICFYINHKKRKNLWGGVEKRLLYAGSGIFSLMVLLANYKIIFYSDVPEYANEIFVLIYKLFIVLFMGGGGYFAAWNILYCFGHKLEDFSWEIKKNKIAALAIFFISFLGISVFDIIILFVCKYPGNFTVDSREQIGQLLTGNYSNHHPFYHTITIKLFITLGLKLFDDINAAVALYHVFQILFMSMCFSVALFTLYEKGISLKYIIIILVWYVLMPFHIMYSFTMWKDVMFGGFVLLFITFIFRVLNKIGSNKIFNYAMLLISGLGVCLFRSNGFFSFVMISIIFFVLFGKSWKNICAMFAVIIALSFFMKHLVLSNLGINQPDTIEALSVPAQQIARVIIEHNDFKDEQRKLLSKVVDIEAVPENYNPCLSDPIKDLVRNKGNQQYIKDNKFAYIKLYLEIGFKHPLTYIRAWTDQTKGFWNAGYLYWRWADLVSENEYGIKRTINSEKINRYFNEYLWLFENNSFLQIFLCIGFYVWIDLFLCFISIIRKDKTGFFITIPLLAIIFSLLVSTPVYSEFRYAYSVFCSLPFIIFATFCKNSIGRGEIYG